MNLLNELGLTASTPVGLDAYLAVGALLFMFGLTACVTRRNAIGILIGVELILNAAVLNFMAFWRFSGNPVQGEGALGGPVMAVFIIVLAACEAAIALAILLNLYFNFGSIEVDEMKEMKR